MHAHFLWEAPPGCPVELPLYLLERGDARSLASQVSCRQDIACDGAFSLGMFAEFGAMLVARGRVVLPAPLLGGGPRRPGALPGSGGGRCARHRHRLLLRRSGASSIRFTGPDISIPVPLHRRRCGGRSTSDDAATVRGRQCILKCLICLFDLSLSLDVGCYECTFCAACVNAVLGKVCPNCGGGLPHPCWH